MLRGAKMPRSGHHQKRGAVAGDGDRIELSLGGHSVSERAIPMSGPTCAADIMTASPRTASPITDVAMVAAMMRDNEIGIVPIVDTDHRVVGVITDRDIVVRADANATPVATLKAVDIMTRKAVTVHPRDDIHDVIDRMAEARVHRILVVDELEKLVGIISLSDLARRTDLPERVQDAIDQIARRHA
jgi:CBS domain-containing protein